MVVGISIWATDAAPVRIAMISQDVYGMTRLPAVQTQIGGVTSHSAHCRLG